MAARRLSLVIALAISLPPSAARAEDPQALVVPLGGTVEGDLANAPARFTEELNAAVTEAGTAPISASIQRKELSAIAGCDDDSERCLASIAETMGVARVALGEVQTTAQGKLAVTLTLFATGQPVLRSLVVLDSTDIDDATAEFGTKVRDLLAGRPVRDVEPKPDPPPDPTPDPTPPVVTPSTGGAFDFGRVKPYSYAVAGGGVALLVGGAVFYALASSKQSAIDDAPTDTLEQLQELDRLESRGKTYAMAGNIATVAGGVAAAAGITLIVLQGRSGEAQPAAQVTPTAMGDGLGLTFTVWGDL